MLLIFWNKSAILYKIALLVDTQIFTISSFCMTANQSELRVKPEYSPIRL